MIHQSTSYLKFLRRSKNQHGVHSPFVYSLVTKCFYNKQQHTAYELIKKHRKWLKKNKQTITVTDFGFGSRLFSGNKRQVSKIAKRAGITPKRARLLNRLVRYLNVESALEFGTSLGLGAAALASGNPQTNITTIEGCPNTTAIAKEGFKKFGFKRIKTQVGRFQDVLQKLDGQYDLIVIDGHHTEEGTLQLFNESLNIIHNDSVLIIDDIYLNKPMTRAWQSIIKHPRVTVSIDTYKWGLVFFRKEQVKEHFVIRV